MIKICGKKLGKEQQKFIARNTTKKQKQIKIKKECKKNVQLKEK